MICCSGHQIFVRNIYIHNTGPDTANTAMQTAEGYPMGSNCNEICFCRLLVPSLEYTIHILCDLPFPTVRLTSLWSLFYRNGNSFPSTICMFAKNEFQSNSQRWTNSTLNCWAASDSNFFRRFSTNATVPLCRRYFRQLSIWHAWLVALSFERRVRASLRLGSNLPQTEAISHRTQNLQEDVIVTK